MALSKTLLYSGPTTDILIDATHIYYTLDGVHINFETVFADIETDQVPGITRKKKLHHKITIAFKVPELSADLLMLATAQPDSNLVGSTLTIDNDNRTSSSVEIYIPSVSGRVYVVLFYACYCLGATEIHFGKSQQVAWEIKFEAVYDTTQSKYGIALEGE